MTFTTKLLAGAAGIRHLRLLPPVAPILRLSRRFLRRSLRERLRVRQNTNVAAQQCTAAVQQRLYNRSSIGGILGAVLGANTTAGCCRDAGLAAQQRDGPRAWPRQQRPLCLQRLRSVRRRRLWRAGLRLCQLGRSQFPCDVAPNGAIYNVDINRRY